MTASYKNKQTKETYELCGVKDLAQAWRMAAFVCRSNNWNFDMFCEDVSVKVRE